MSIPNQSIWFASAYNLCCLKVVFGLVYSCYQKGKAKRSLWRDHLSANCHVVGPTSARGQMRSISFSQAATGQNKDSSRNDQVNVDLDQRIHALILSYHAMM